MKKLKEIIGLYSLTGLFIVLFLATQTLCSLHSHDPFHDTHHTPKQQMECDVCLLAGMPIDTAGAHNISLALTESETAATLPINQLKRLFNISTDRARAPPLV